MVMSQLDNNTMTLDKAPLGLPLKMLKFSLGQSPLRQKLLAMGFLPGAIIKICAIAPLVDPLKIFLRGHTISLRKCECKQIEVECLSESKTVACQGHNSCTCW
jgi:Fe2+ transport system protein FeoA